MKLLKQLALSSFLLLSLNASAAQTDVDALAMQTNVEAQLVYEISGLMPTALECEAISSDIVYEEIKSTGLTVEAAQLKYQLTPTAVRSITIKQTRAITTGSNGGGVDPE